MTISKPPVVILGSNSYSGAVCAQFVLQFSDVVGISRSNEPPLALLPYRWNRTPGTFRFEQAHLYHDAERIGALLAEIQPEYIINFAAQSMVAESWLTPQDWYLTNVAGTAKVTEYARRLPSLKRWVQISTPEVYGNNTGQLTEATPMSPSTPYAVSKAACDMHLLALHRQYQFPVVFTRAANVYGPGQPLYRIIPKTAWLAMSGGQLPLQGGGLSERAFIHGGDMSSGTWLAATRGQNGQCYHLSPGREHTIRAVVELICRTANVDPATVINMAPERPGKDARYGLDATKAKNELGWIPKVSLEQGIEQVVAWAHWFRSELQHLPILYTHKQ
jgi:dTDP-glucose 4,6-dehydratase